MTTPNLTTVFAALADPTRRAILMRLAEGDSAVSALAKPFDMSLPAVHKHLGILEEAGLISSRKAGRVRTCKLEAAPMQDAVAWLEFYSRFWEERLDALEAFIKEHKRRQKKQPPSNKKQKL